MTKLSSFIRTGVKLVGKASAELAGRIGSTRINFANAPFQPTIEQVGRWIGGMKGLRLSNLTRSLLINSAEEGALPMAVKRQALDSAVSPIGVVVRGRIASRLALLKAAFPRSARRMPSVKRSPSSIMSKVRSKLRTTGHKAEQAVHRYWMSAKAPRAFRLSWRLARVAKRCAAAVGLSTVAVVIWNGPSEGKIAGSFIQQVGAFLRSVLTYLAAHLKMLVPRSKILGSAGIKKVMSRHWIARLLLTLSPSLPWAKRVFKRLFRGKGHYDRK